MIWIPIEIINNMPAIFNSIILYKVKKHFLKSIQQPLASSDTMYSCQTLTIVHRSSNSHKIELKGNLPGLNNNLMTTTLVVRFLLLFMQYYLIELLSFFFLVHVKLVFTNFWTSENSLIMFCRCQPVWAQSMWKWWYMYPTRHWVYKLRLRLPIMLYWGHL